MTDWEMPPPVPEGEDDQHSIELDMESPLNLSPEGMGCLVKATGRRMTDMLQDDENESARFQVMIFAELWRRYQRLGHLPDAATIWERAGQTRIVFKSSSTSDPLDDGSSTTSPFSAGTGA